MVIVMAQSFILVVPFVFVDRSKAANIDRSDCLGFSVFLVKTRLNRRERQTHPDFPWRSARELLRRCDLPVEHPLAN